MTLTSGTTTPTSKFGVTPTVPEIASVLLVTSRLPVVVPVASGVVAVTVPIGRDVSEKSLNLSYVVELNVAPTLTLPLRRTSAPAR